MSIRSPNEQIQLFVQLSKDSVGDIFWSTISVSPNRGNSFNVELEFDVLWLNENGHEFEDDDSLLDAIEDFLEETLAGWEFDVESVVELPYHLIRVQCIGTNVANSTKSYKMLNMRKLADAMDAIIVDLTEYADNLDVKAAIDHIHAAHERIVAFSKNISNDPYKGDS